MLWFWVIVLVAIIGAVAVVAAGRGDSMADVYDDRPDAGIPTGRPITADDLRNLRLNTGVRGYRMDEVDALVDRLAAELLARETEDVRILARRDEERSDAEPEVHEVQSEGESSGPSERP